MAAVLPPDDAQALGADLRTVVVLLTGVRLPESVCVAHVETVLEGGDSPVQEAVVYLLATHLLALGERAMLDSLAWRWLSARDGARHWTVRRAADAVRLGIFAVESGWAGPLLRRLVTLVGISRATPVWVDLTDLARTGGRHAERLRPLLFRTDLWDLHDPCRAAALTALGGAHELHRLHARVGRGYAVLANTSPDCLTTTVFTRAPELPGPALREARELTALHGLVHAVHAHAGGVRLLPLDEDPRVVPLHAPDGMLDESLVLAARALTPVAGPANLPSLLALPPERVLDVFRSGPALAREGRYWVAGRGAREAR